VCLPLYALGCAYRVELVMKRVLPAPSAVRASVIPKGTFSSDRCADGAERLRYLRISAVLIELLKAEGSSPTDSRSDSLTLGVIQVSARGASTSRWRAVGWAHARPHCRMALTSRCCADDRGGSHGRSPPHFGGLAWAAAQRCRGARPYAVFYDKTEFVKATSRIALRSI